MKHFQTVILALVIATMPPQYRLYEPINATIDAPVQIQNKEATEAQISAGVFEITAYTAGPESTGKVPGDPKYGITASGKTVEEGVTIAADWTILPKGTRVYIPGVGEREVQDKGGAIKGNKIDIYMSDLNAAIEWGRRELEVFILP